MLIESSNQLCMLFVVDDFLQQVQGPSEIAEENFEASEGGATPQTPRRPASWTAHCAPGSHLEAQGSWGQNQPHTIMDVVGMYAFLVALGQSYTRPSRNWLGHAMPNCK